MTAESAATTSPPAAPRWDPQQYERFGAERSRPFADLLARVDLPGARAVADLGCGTGSLTARLLAEWPAARVTGVDSSPEMLREARRREIPGRLEFELGDARQWEPDEPLDVLLTNATLQWVPGHLELLGRLSGLLAPGGVLALQVPGNFGEPTHRLLADLVADDRFAPSLAGIASPSSHDPAGYLDALLGAGLAADAWETTYFQLLTGEDAVLEWMKGTALRPVLTALPEGEREEFLAEYGSRLRAAYPPGEHGTLLPYRRVFAVGRRPGSSQASAVCRLDHAQLAMPPGMEEAARTFYAGLLGMAEAPKPPALAARGGCWFQGHGTEVHLGVEQDFRPAVKAHVALAVTDLDEMAARIATAGHAVRSDDELLPRRRFFTDDPFGNRVEILARD